MWVQPPRIESIFISFVSFSFNKRHVSIQTRTSIRAIGAIRVRIKRQRKIRVKRYSFYSDYYFPSVSGPTANLVLKKNSNMWFIG